SFLFLAAFFVAAGRSRDERLHMAGVVWLSGSAPPGVARALRSTVSVQCAVALVAAAVRPFSAVAFGILAPVFGLGCLAWYGARHGTFPAILTGQGAPVADGSARASEAPDAARVEPRRRGDESRDETADPDDFDQLFRRRKGMRR
ncbi:MAG: hypothetical protein JST73_11880, partial [Actinobacteria bacterium]|nr:hypothetical protein [Actinomycetota bacterium]